MERKAAIKAEFDELLKEADRAVVALDTEALDQAMTRLDVWAEERLPSLEGNADTLQSIRRGMIRFREQCRFVGNILQDVVTGAVKGESAEKADYAYRPSGEAGEREIDPVLMKQYG